jgi:thiosulfate/3-mercaptopyruvate sulfurtransferase
MSPILSAQALHAKLDQYKIIDVTHSLQDVDFGINSYLAGHIPGAHFVHLDHGLSDLSRKQELGRHPLPSPDAFALTLASCGIKRADSVLCYDQDSGAFAARAWWLLRAAGFNNVCVLDGGFAAWTQGNLPISTEVPVLQANAPETLDFDAMAQVSFAQVQTAVTQKTALLLDARAANRFAGQDEVIDPIAGHVPGAVNRPFSSNLQNGRFKASNVLRAEFAALLGQFAPAQSMMMCGSGVTACHNILAMHSAGLPGAALFAPSWSGWILHAERAIAIGA